MSLEHSVAKTSLSTGFKHLISVEVRPCFRRSDQSPFITKECWPTTINLIATGTVETRGFSTSEDPPQTANSGSRRAFSRRFAVCLAFFAINLAIMSSSWVSYALWLGFAAQLSTGAVGSSESFARVTLDNDELALCNDGSPATYYIEQSEESDNGAWLVYLEGGGWCYDEATCASRYENSESVSPHSDTP